MSKTPQFRTYFTIGDLQYKFDKTSLLVTITDLLEAGASEVQIIRHIVEENVEPESPHAVDEPVYFDTEDGSYVGQRID